MNMSDEEQHYVIEQIELLIKYAAASGALLALGQNEEYLKALVKLENQKRHILSMDGIEIL